MLEQVQNQLSLSNCFYIFKSTLPAQQQVHFIFSFAFCPGLLEVEATCGRKWHDSAMWMSRNTSISSHPRSRRVLHCLPLPRGVARNDFSNRDAIPWGGRCLLLEAIQWRDISRRTRGYLEALAVHERTTHHRSVSAPHSFVPLSWYP